MIQLDNYRITFNEENDLNALINRLSPSNVVILVDEHTEELCLPLLYEATDHTFNIIRIPSGEAYKSIDTCQLIWDRMLELKMDRKSLLINLGGGVIGDMGGFCASTYMRGINYIHIPTTLLSQVDSSVGGKLGIDFGNVKNIVGVFANPSQVMIDTRFLKTLPYKQLLSGYAEIIKHGLIADKAYFNQLTEYEDLANIPFNTVVSQSVLIKSQIVEQDPFEQGLRKILNYGHTVGHAVESYALENRDLLLHGEAIAIGMIVEAYIAMKKGILKEEYFNIIEQYLLNLYGNKSKLISDSDALINIMKHDKKNRGGKILMSLIDAIGSCQFDVEVTAQEIKDGLSYYTKR